jgi:dTDP-4-amino-4,6-dideoxygalactose transaminase
MSPRYHHQAVGINSRLDSIQAAVLNVKLTRLEGWTAQRAENAARYGTLLNDSGLGVDVIQPLCDSRNHHVWNQYTIRIPGGRRDAVKAQLAAAGIGAEVYYPVPLHLQKCFQSLGYGLGALPHTEKAAREVLSLPIFPELTADEQKTVVSGLCDALRHSLRKAA